MFQPVPDDTGPMVTIGRQSRAQHPTPGQVDNSYRVEPIEGDGDQG